MSKEQNLCEHLGSIPVDLGPIEVFVSQYSAEIWAFYDDTNTPYHKVISLPFFSELHMFKSIDSFILMGPWLNQLPLQTELRTYFANHTIASSMLVFSKGHIKRHKDLQRQMALNIGIKNTDRSHTIVWSDDGDLIAFARYKKNEAILLSTAHFHSVYVDDSTSERDERVVLSLEIKRASD